MQAECARTTFCIEGWAEVEGSAVCILCLMGSRVSQRGCEGPFFLLRGWAEVEGRRASCVLWAGGLPKREEVEDRQRQGGEACQARCGHATRNSTCCSVSGGMVLLMTVLEVVLLARLRGGVRPASISCEPRLGAPNLQLDMIPIQLEKCKNERIQAPIILIDSIDIQ